jgi:hypothetical protein
MSAPRVPIGTHVVLPSPFATPVAVFHSVDYEVGDGELIVRTRGGNFLHFRPGAWVAIGTAECTDGVEWVAIETYAEGIDKQDLALALANAGRPLFPWSYGDQEVAP